MPQMRIVYYPESEKVSRDGALVGPPSFNTDNLASTENLKWPAFTKSPNVNGNEHDSRMFKPTKELRESFLY